MNSEMTFPFVIGSSLFSAAIAGYFGGTGWAITIGILMFFTGLSKLWDERKTKQQAKQHTYNDLENIQDNTAPTTTPKPRKKYIDQINFEYRTKEGLQDFYTVNVYKGITGNIEGWCHEREDVRTFRIDRIINDNITRTETGEVLTVKEWRKAMREKNAQARAEAS